MNGLKNVRNRRDDALTRVGWDRLEVMLADYYRATTPDRSGGQTITSD